MGWGGGGRGRVRPRRARGRPRGAGGGRGAALARRRAPWLTASCAASSRERARTGCPPAGRASPTGRPRAERRRLWWRPMCQCRLGPRGCRAARRAFTVWSGAVRPHSQPASVFPLGVAISARPRRGGLAGCCAASQCVAQPAPCRRSTRALRSGRVALAHDLVWTWEWHSERGARAAPYRSSGCGLIVVGSSAHAAGPGRRRFVRRSAGGRGGPWVDAWEAHNRSGRPRKRAARHPDAGQPGAQYEVDGRPAVCAAVELLTAQLRDRGGCG